MGSATRTWQSGTLLKAVAAIIAAALAAAAIAAPAEAADVKVAIPSITKAVSTNGTSFGEAGAAVAGQTARYRLEATLPEDMGSRERLDYTVVDTAERAIEPVPASVTAILVGADGKRKATLAATASAAETDDGTRMEITLGDMRAVEPEAEFGDAVVIEYEAKIADDAEAGEHRNMAKLVYGDGKSSSETEEAMAKVRTGETAPPPAAPGDAEPGKGADGDEGGKAGGAGFAKTGDATGPARAMACVLAALAAVVAAETWADRKAARKRGRKARHGG